MSDPTRDTTMQELAPAWPEFHDPDAERDDSPQPDRAPEPEPTRCPNMVLQRIPGTSPWAMECPRCGRQWAYRQAPGAGNTHFPPASPQPDTAPEGPRWHVKPSGLTWRRRTTHGAVDYEAHLTPWALADQWGNGTRDQEEATEAIAALAAVLVDPARTGDDEPQETHNQVADERDAVRDERDALLAMVESCRELVGEADLMHGRGTSVLHRDLAAIVGYPASPTEADGFRRALDASPTEGNPE